MASVRPRALTHRGVIEASGLLFDTNFHSPIAAQKRLLTCWTSGAIVYRVKNGYLLRFPAPKRIVCEFAPGIPLVMESGCLLTAPLSSRELRALHPLAGSLVSLRNGAAFVEPLPHGAQEDPADWISLEGWKSLEVTSLGLLPPPPRLVAESSSFDSRSRLEGVPPESPQRAEALKALRLALQGEKSDEKARTGNLQHAVGKWLQQMAVVLKQRQQFKRNNSPSTDGHRGNSRQDGLSFPVAPLGQNFMDRLADQMNHLAARLLLSSGLARQIGRKQTEYIERMMQMFNRGELDEALRHAIGLSEVDGGRLLPPLLRTPAPRSDLTVAASQTPARNSLNTDAELFSQLRALYRKAFENLEAEGRIDEAAFVLAELLGVNEEAVAFLERHSRLQLAAEMAEARRLPPGLIIRLWFLAGNRERAAQVARRTGAFADAVQRMARIDTTKASELRLFWAASLIEAGDYGTAIEALWPDLSLRPITLDWIDKTLILGGPVAARMLARKLTLVPDHDKATCEQVLDLLEDEQAETAPERLDFSTALIKENAVPAARSAARAAVRALLRDTGNGHSRIGTDDFHSLLRLANDGVLRADVPALPALPAGGLLTPLILTAPRAIAIQAADTGSFPVYDCALLRGGQSLVALGEAGVRLVTRDGRTLAHFEQPAHRLVISDSNDRAIVLAPRGDVWRMAKLDFVTRRAEPWREAAFRAFANTYDGALWFVSIENDLIAIDTASNCFNALWRMPNLDGKIVSLARSGQHCSFLLYDSGGQNALETQNKGEPRQERWTYSLPALMLRDRNEVPLPSPLLMPGENLSAAITAEGMSVYLTIQPNPQMSLAPEDARPYLLTATDPTKGVLFEQALQEAATPLPPVFSTTWAAFSLRSARGMTCLLLDRREWKVRARFTLDGAATLSARFTDSRLTLGDNRGRLLALELESGQILRNLRIK